MAKISNFHSPKLNQVEINDSFWSFYQKLVREVVIPYQWEVLNDRVEGAEKSHAVENFRIAAGLSKGDFYGCIFQDSDIAKWLESVAYSLETHPDKNLEAIADEMIELIGKAQQSDGYLNTKFIIANADERWTNLHEAHELYCAGHMLEAAVAYFTATGKSTLLDIMTRNIEHIFNKFGNEEGNLRGYPGHQELELALVKLYRLTNDERHLKLCEYFLRERGAKPYYFDIEWEKRGKTSHWTGARSNPPSWSTEYNQAHKPVLEQDVAVGHAVRAVYMYTGMASLAGETGDKELLNACKRLWNNIIHKQMYITGGIGSTNIGEAFTFDYDLPNDIVYAETCASIGLIFFAHAMLEIEPSSEYADVIERALYNISIASMARDGKSFFYVNPLEVLPAASEKNPTRHHVKSTRQPWFGCACCPPNLARLLASLGQYIYTQKDDTIYCHLYIGNETSFDIADGGAKLSLETDYPWNGDVKITVDEASVGEFDLALRIPSWCREYELSINGEPISGYEIRDGYAHIKRTWQSGDKVELSLKMQIELMQANPQVRADAGKVAIMRGPLVYCLEQEDNGENLSAITLSVKDVLTQEVDNALCNGAVVIRAKGERCDESTWCNALYRPYKTQQHSIDIKAVPYFLWGNRQKGEMQVWIRKG